MDYRDALEACLDSIRAGEDRERAIAAYPEHAEQLREDVALSQAVHAYSTRNAQPSDDATARARLRLNNELAGLRNQRSAKAPSRGLWRMPLLQGLALGVVALVAVGVLAFSGIFGGAQTANAETIDGVVVETNANGIVLQTQDGLQTVALDQASNITDENGAALSATSLQAGQVIQIRAKRLRGVLRAIAVQKRPTGALEAWCRMHAVRCQEVEPKLPPSALACEASAGPCVLPTPAAGSPAPGSQADRTRLQDLADRCQRNGGAPCEELRTFCRNNLGVCAVLTGWLRTMLGLPDNAQQRIQIQGQRCQNGSILDCRELRLFCERTNQPCPASTPNRPATKATPRRPF